MTILRTLSASVGALLAIGLAAGPAGAATELEGSLTLHATSVIDRPGVDPKSDVAHDVLTPTHQSLFGTVSATATDGADSVVSHATESAVWQSADRGTFTVTNMGHEFNVSTPGSIETLLSGNLTNDFDWNYAFRADADGVFNLDFDIVGTGPGSLFGLGDWQLEMVGDGLQFFDISDTFAGTRDPSDNEHMGSFSHPLRAGVAYRFALMNLNSLGTVSPNHAVAAENDYFSWSIRDNSAVPEPSSWALSLLGFGLAGAALRRRRGRFAVPLCIPSQELIAARCGL
ncbi:PEPxxWA-CTERM sorting domain-containing protein [Phenylobacterium sp.]|uniref:PEPxxWA-CTERM sorting domain-containing protein n=1 Tax=Phenylobacterium sp. TaxID=1871053 RepID=UPI003562FDAD